MIVFLAKVFSGPQHAHDLIKGKLYANRLRYFMNIEGDATRGDPEEGAMMPQLEGLAFDITSTDRTTGQVNKVTITNPNVAEISGRSRCEVGRDGRHCWYC